MPTHPGHPETRPFLLKPSPKSKGCVLSFPLVVNSWHLRLFARIKSSGASMLIQSKHI
jgi:hypothetical protein